VRSKFTTFEHPVTNAEIDLADSLRAKVYYMQL
jgi:hypothetical protein